MIFAKSHLDLHNIRNNVERVKKLSNRVQVIAGNVATGDGCKALIDAQAERLMTLGEIARAAGVEASSVCRWFRRYQGTSPYQYLLRRKMNIG